MKKKLLLFLSILGMVMIFATACSTNTKMSKSDLEESFNTTNAATLKTYKVTRSTEKKSKYLKQVKKSIDIIDQEDQKLEKNTENKKLTKALMNMNKKMRRTLNSFKDEEFEDYFYASSKKIADQYFDGSDTKAIKNWIKWDKKIDAENDNSSDENTDDETNDSEGYKYTDIKKHKTDWSDSSWAGVQTSIDNINVGKFDGDYEDSDGTTLQGLIGVHFNVSSPDYDVKIYPNQGTLTTNDGQQIDADIYESDDVGGDLLKGAKKDGWVYFFIPNMQNATDITSVRIIFTGNNYGDDDFAYDTHKDYDTGIIQL